VTETSTAGAAPDTALPLPEGALPKVRKLMIATEGREIAYPVIVKALELARPHNAEVFVMSIARVWGTSLGFPNPWLNPSKREWDEQKLIVRTAVEKMEKAGLEANGLVLATRRASRRIAKEAHLRGMDAIVMGCEPPRRLVGDFMWSQEPHRVARRAKMPVILVPLD
jgi:nucleotide-binding universal stress UspA family protein